MAALEPAPELKPALALRLRLKLGLGVWVEPGLEVVPEPESEVMREPVLESRVDGFPSVSGLTPGACLATATGYAR